MLNEKYLEIIKKFRLIDDTFFNFCFDDNPEDVQYILRIILEKPDLKVLKVQTQKSVENVYGRSVLPTTRVSFTISKCNARTRVRFRLVPDIILPCSIITS